MLTRIFEQVPGPATVRDLDPAALVVVIESGHRHESVLVARRTVRWRRCRNLTCRFPGCSRPAVVCDVDHTIAFNHRDPASGGLTVLENLKCLCRQHHFLKAFPEERISLAERARRAAQLRSGRRRLLGGPWAVAAIIAILRTPETKGTNLEA
jgi:hypothetical protein